MEEGGDQNQCEPKATLGGAAGLPGRIPHDFRRMAVRNLERAGVPRSTAAQGAGHAR